LSHQSIEKNKKPNYIIIPKDIVIREYDIRTPKGNQARKMRTLKQGQKLLCVDEFLSSHPFRHGMYYKLLDETDGYMYYVYTKDVEHKKELITEHTRIRDWYMKAYPTDDLGSSIKSNITFYNAFECLDARKDFYKFLGVGDSIVRERVFMQLAIIMNCDYDYIYSQWLS